MEAAPSAAFEVSEPNLLLELLIVALDAPAQLGKIDKRRKIDVFRQGREPVFGRRLFALGPLDQQPLLRARFGELLVAMRRANPQAGKPRGKRRGGTFAPGDGLPRPLRQAQRQRLDGERPMLAVAAPPLPRAATAGA